jgi:hypothetical protein
MSDDLNLILDTLINVSNIINAIDARLQARAGSETPIKDIGLVATSALSALTAVVGAVVGYVTAKRQQKISIEIADRQINASKETTVLQIQAHENVALKNLDRTTETARLEMQASVIAKSRIEWLKELRTEISSFVGICEGYNQICRFPDQTVSNAERSAVFARAWEKYSHVQLLLNPDKGDHKNIVTTAAKLLAETSEPDLDASRRVARRDDFVRAAQKVLKDEWRNTKAEVRASRLGD